MEHSHSGSAPVLLRLFGQCLTSTSRCSFLFDPSVLIILKDSASSKPSHFGLVATKGHSFFVLIREGGKATAA
jgi:hypothetical protein